MEQLNEELKYILDTFDIQVLPNSPNYWLIRTESGSFYDIFKNENYVSIGFDKIDIDDINNIKDKELKEKISILYPDYKKPGLVLGQLKKFLFEIEKGDIIIIPSKNSKSLCIGQAISNPYQVKEEIKNKELKNDILTYKKRIDIKWIAEIKRNAFDVYIYRLLTSHQGIVSANAYKYYINRMIFPIYYQNGNIHLCFYINKENNISLDDTFNFYSTIKDAINLYNSITESSIIGEISVKSTVNSPGVIEFFGHPEIIIPILFVLFLCGGKIEAKFTKDEKKIEISTDGFLEKLLKFYKEFNKKNTDENKIKLEKFKIKSANSLNAMNTNLVSKRKTENNIILVEKNTTKSQKNEYLGQQSLFDDLYQ